MAFVPPTVPLNYLQPPDQEVSEADKKKNNYAWYVQWGRYVVSNFWNPLRSTFMPGFDTSMDRLNDRMVENIVYYYGVQGLKSLNYARASNSNRSVQAVFIPDQKIRTLVDYMKGNVIEMIQPLKDSISAKGLTPHIQSERDILWSQLKAQYYLEQQLQGTGVAYKPLPDKQFESLQDIDDFMAEWQHEYEITATAITQNIYYDQNLSVQLENDGFQVLLGSICSTLVEVENGKVINTEIPCYNAIYDYRSKDQYGKGAMIAGGVFNATPAELFAKFPSLTIEERQEISWAVTGGETSKDFCQFYNDNQPNVIWWNQASGTVTYAIVYFIARKDLQYKVLPNSFGGEKIINISEGMATYATTGKEAKKVDPAGTEWAWMVHKCVLIGNKIAVDCGYPPYQIRQGGAKVIPELPIKQLYHASINGFARSVVDRLRQHADFRGLLMEKVQELVANDIGKAYFINGSVIDQFDSAEEILKDFKAMKIHVRTGVSGEANDPINGQKTVEMVDMSLDPNIMNYIRLADNESRLMEEIVSIPAVALGQQTDTIGKGVQQRTITQATLGQKSFYSSLMEHWRQKFQYNFNVAKLLYTEQPNTIKLLPISEKQTYMLNVTKAFRAEQLGIYIRPNDPIEEKDMQIFEQSILGFMQNINAPGALEGLKTSLSLIKSNTFTEALENIEKQIRVNKKAQAVLMTAEQQANATQQAQQAQAAQQAIILQQYGDLMRKLQEIETKAAWDYKTKVDVALLNQETQKGQLEAAALIQNAHAEVQHQRDMELQQLGQQQEMEQNDQLNEHAMEQQDNMPAPAAPAS